MLYHFLLIYFLLFNTVLLPANTETTSVVKDTEEQVSPSTNSTNLKDDEFSKLLDKELGRQQSNAQFDEKRPSWGWQIIKTIFVLCFLIGLLWIIWKIYIFKKKIPQKDSQIFKVLHEYPLEGNRTIKLLLFNGKILMMASSEAGIQLIQEINDPTAINQIILDCEKEQQNEQPDFLIELSKAISTKFSSIINPMPIPKAQNIEANIESNNIPWEVLRAESTKKLNKIKQERNNIHNDNTTTEL